jgi:hypothetical protein
MSSPTKQVSARRLPPLANPNPGKLLRRSPKTATDVEEREALMSNVGTSSSNVHRPSSRDNKRRFITSVDMGIPGKSFFSITECKFKVELPKILGCIDLFGQTYVTFPLPFYFQN